MSGTELEERMMQFDHPARIDAEYDLAFQAAQEYYALRAPNTETRRHETLMHSDWECGRNHDYEAAA